MLSIIKYVRCHRWITLAITIGCACALMLIISWPGIQRRYAAERMIRAINDAHDADLEASPLLSSAVERVKHFKAQDQAIAKLIPLIDVQHGKVSMPAMFCLLELNAHSPDVVTALIAAYRNPLASVHSRIEAAGSLTFLAPESAEKCGAAAATRRYVAGLRGLKGVEAQTRLAEEVLRAEGADRRADEADPAAP
jgi:hypothetical protein